MKLIKSGTPAHRYSALVILLLLLYIVMLIVTGLLQQGNEVQSRYESMVLQLHKYQQLVAGEETVKEEHQRLQALLDQNDRYLTAATDSLALAALQKNLQQVIQASGANLVSMQALDVGDDEQTTFSPVKMQLHLKLTHQALSKLLYLLENQRPIGFIYNLRVQKSGRSFRQVETEGVTLLEAYLDYTVYRMAADDI